MTSRRKNFFLPPRLDLIELQLLFGESNRQKAIVDNVCLLYTLLCQDLVSQHLLNYQNGYTQLHSMWLETIFGNDYKQVIDLLLSQDYLEINQFSPTGEYYPEGYYSKTLKCAKAYRIPGHLRAKDKLFVRVALPKQCRVLCSKIDRLNHVSNDPAVATDHCRQLVLEKVDNLVLLDNDDTRFIIKSLLLSKGRPYDEALAAAIIEQFNFGPVHHPSVCAFGGRLHSRLTKIYKQLRPQLRFENYLQDAMVEIDLVASQPWFLSVVSPRLIKQFVPECQEAIPFFKDVAHKEDVLLFRAKCANPDKNQGIYDHLRDLYNAKYGESFTRDQAKAICYRAFFCDYSRKEKTSVSQCARVVEQWEQRVATHLDQDLEQGELTLPPLAQASLASIRKDEAAMLKKAKNKLFTQKCYEIFRDNFPGMHQLFTNIKQLHWDFERGQREGKVTKQYANNALLAQRLESGVVFGVVVRALMEANLTNTVTIHDAFLVRKCDEAKARKVIKKAFNSVGLKPNFK